MKEALRAAGASLAVIGGNALAAVPVGLQTAIDAATIDTKDVALGMLLLAVGILVYKWFRKAL